MGGGGQDQPWGKEVNKDAGLSQDFREVSGSEGLHGVGLGGEPGGGEADQARTGGDLAKAATS